MRTRIQGSVLASILVVVSGSAGAQDDPGAVQLGLRPFYLIDQMTESGLKDALERCADRPFQRRDWSIGHRGAPLQFPEHTRESYVAAARMGAGIVECDVTFTKDRELVCRHAQCDLHTTTNILATDLAETCIQPFRPADPATGRPASARCCTSDLTLDQFKTLRGKMDAADMTATTVEDYLSGTADFRTDLYSPGTLVTHAESITLLKELGVKFTPELKAPEVPMPFEGEYTQAMYAQQMIDAYREAGVPPEHVWPQSFRLGDILYWLEHEPEFGRQAVFLDGRYDQLGFDPQHPATWSPTMEELVARGVRIIAPPTFMLVTLDGAGRIVPSAYAEHAKAAGLDIISWTVERSGPLGGGGDFYYQSVRDAIDDDGDLMVLMDVLAQDVGVIGLFSDWPATTTYYANCFGLR